MDAVEIIECGIDEQRKLHQKRDAGDAVRNPPLDDKRINENKAKPRTSQYRLDEATPAPK